MEIAPNVHRIPGVIANTYLIVSSAGLTLIDAGLPHFGGQILRYVRSLGYQSKDVKWILITHGDVDHVGSLAALKTATGAVVAANAVEAEAIREGRRPRELVYRGLATLPMVVLATLLEAPPAPVDEELTPGLELPLLGGLQVLDTPGHTAGHVSLWAPGPRILFSGDSFLIRPYRFFPSRGTNNWDQTLSNQSFRVQAMLHPAIVCGGHGWTDKDVEAKFGRG